MYETDNTTQQNTATQNEPAYPLHDKADRQGIYCEHCGTIFYVPCGFSFRVIARECPFCGDRRENSTLYWIAMLKEFQPEGDGF